MAKILHFQKKPKKMEFEEFHNMWASREDEWIVWRCYTCARKVKISQKTKEFVIERKGNFYAHHNGSFDHIQPAENV